MRREPFAFAASAVLAILICAGGCSNADGTDSGDPATSTDGTNPGGASGGNRRGGSSASNMSGTIEDPTDTTPRVRYVGRVDTSDSSGPRLAWAGTRIVVRFNGPALKVKIREQSISEGPSGYDVFVDGALKDGPFVPNDGEGVYEIASGLDAGNSHVVELYRRTEPMVGITQILGFEFPNGGALLAPPSWPDRRIEILGDSESTGYGIDCTDRSQPFSGATENERKSYPAIVGKTLGAEIHNVSFSGKGIIRNEVPSDHEVFFDLYAKSIPLASGAGEWDFSTWRPDVVWMELGANDWGPGASGDLPPPDAAEFKDKYKKLFAFVREKNPNAHIVCVLQGMLNDDYPADYHAYSNLKRILNEIVDERHAANDAKVYFHEVPRANSDRDLTGCAWHPNPAYHEKAAASVAAKVREITGWR